MSQPPTPRSPSSLGPLSPQPLSSDSGSAATSIVIEEPTGAGAGASTTASAGPTTTSAPPDMASSSPQRHDMLSVPRSNSQSQLRAGGQRKPTGMGAAVLHNTDLAKIANEEWQSLLKGEKYYCQLVIGATNETRDVVLNVNLSGIRLLDRKTDAVINQFDIEQILQYSYSQQNSTFSFSYLEEGRFFVTHKFISKDYFEIHQYLGNAIAIVIKLKTQIKKNGPAETLNMIDTQRSERTHSVDTLRRSSRAKLYFEQKYRNRGSASPTDATAEEAAARTSQESLPMSPRGASEESPDGRASTAGAHLQSLFAPPSKDGSPEKRTSDNGRKDHVERELRKFKEYTRDSSSSLTASATAAGGNQSNNTSVSAIEGASEDGSKPPHAGDYDDGHESSRPTIRSSESSYSLAATKSSESIRSKKNWAGSLRLGKGVNIEGLMGSLRKKPTVKPPTAEEVERQMKRMTMFNNTTFNPEDLPPQQVNTDTQGRTRLIKTMTDGQYQITTGTIDGLVEALADENAPDTLYIDDFLLTYRVFLSSTAFFDKLLARYNIQPTVIEDNKDNKEKDKDKKRKAKDESPKERKPDELDSNTVALIRARVLSVFKKWVDRHWYDFENEEMREKLNGLIEQIKSSEYSIVSQQLLNFIGQNEKRKQQMFAEQQPQIPQSLSSTAIVDFVNMDLKQGPMMIARYMCVVAIKFFKQIQPDEFAIHLWSKKDPKLQQEMTRNLIRFIDRYNKIGYWVATEICAEASLPKRIAITERFIQVAKYLFKLQNFNDVSAVMSGLQLTPIYRLRKTWAGISREMITKFRDLEVKMSPENNFKTYRGIEFAAKGDMIPFFALYMRDLQFLVDGNQTFLPNDMVNFEKNRSVMNKIMAIRVSQQSKYELDDVDKGILQYLEMANHKDEDTLKEESNRIEPPTRRRAPSVSESINSEIDAVSISTVNSEETGQGSVVSDVFDSASTVDLPM